MKTTFNSVKAVITVILLTFAAATFAQQDVTPVASQKKVKKVEADNMKNPVAVSQEEMGVPLVPPPPPPPPVKGLNKKGQSGNRKFIEQGHGPQIPGLTDQQRSEIKKLSLKQIQSVTPIKNMIREKTARLNSVLSVQPFNETEAYQLADEIGKLKTSLLKSRIAMHQEIRKLLTPDQQIIFDAKPKPFLMGGKAMKQKAPKGMNME